MNVNANAARRDVSGAMPLTCGYGASVENESPFRVADEAGCEAAAPMVGSSSPHAVIDRRGGMRV